MGRKLKLFAALGMIVCAFSAVSVANAAAASFKASTTGSLTGHALNTQVFTTNGGTVNCTTASTSGTVTSLSAEDQKVTVKYSGCKAFGFANVTISPAEYDLHASGTADILNTITISVPLGGCKVTVGPQSGLSSVGYKNNSGNIIEESAVKGITYTTTGGLCGSGGSNGTYTGNNEVELAGGTVEYVG